MLRRPALVLALVFAVFGAAPARAQSGPTSAMLTWTAPGDDSLSGTATQYDLRVSTSPIDASNFANATSVTGAPQPQPAGTSQSCTVTGLTPNTAYWFAMKTVDDLGNWSGISNIASFTTPASNDSIRPAAPAIAIGVTTDNSVSLTWAATGDDSLSGTASRYEVRWSASAITPANFASATLVTTGVPAPAAPGTSQSVTIGGLNRTVDLYFAVRTADDVYNWSALSNVARAGHLLDTSPPASPSGLTAVKEAAGVHVHWNANGEADLAGYRIYRAATSGGVYAQVNVSLVTTTDFTDASAPDSASLWYEVTAVDAASNESARSAAFRVWLTAGDITAFKLDAPYPNPSALDAPVTLPIEVPAAGPYDGRIDILNGAGERIRSIELRNLTPGTSSVQWDGRNEAGRMTAPGVYRAWLQVGGSSQQVKLLRR